MEQFIQDTGLSQEDLNMDYDDIVEMYKSSKLAMYFGSSSGVKMFQDRALTQHSCHSFRRTVKSGL